MLTPADRERYSRHLVLREIGVAGQEKLKAARVLVIGAGGLGSPSALYLAASGVGTIGVIDCDNVDMSNLQRQVIYDTASVGTPKATVCVRSIRRSNSSRIKSSCAPTTSYSCSKLTTSCSTARIASAHVISRTTRA